MGLVKFYYGGKLPTSPNSDTLYFLNNGKLYRGATLIADATDTIAIQSMIDDAIGGIGKAVRFIGHSSTPITDGGNENPTIDGKVFTNIKAGDIVLYNNQEFIRAASGKWELFGEEGIYATITSLDELSQRVDKIVAGNVQVESAKKADIADEATHAESANTAVQANQALVASEAHYAAQAGQAAQANSATNAEHATTADNATNADEAKHANTATTAEEAEHASAADFSSEAEKANSLNLTEASGSSIKPVYFTADGIPAPITHSIEASVPANAQFTDTISAIASTSGSGNAVTGISVDNVGQLTVVKGNTFALDSDLQELITTLTWTTV